MYTQKVSYDSFLVLGVDFKSPSRFFKLLGFTPHAVTNINKRHGSVDNWTRKHFKTLSEAELISHLEYINNNGMTINKLRACQLIKDAISAQLDRVDITEKDPARTLLRKILLHDNLNEGLKEFVRTM